MLGLLGSIIGAGSSLLGGYFQRKAQQEANRANLAAVEKTNRANALLSAKDRVFQGKWALRSEALQRQAAQMGIRWRVADAKKAGIHPLVAMGAQTFNPSPISVGGSSIPMQAGQVSPEDGLAQGIANAGQDVSRAMYATQDHMQRMQAVQTTAAQLHLEKMGLENELLAAKVGVVRQAGTPPAPQSHNVRYLVEGQGPTAVPAVKRVPLEVVTPDPVFPHQEPGAVVGIGVARTRDGGYFPVRSVDVQDRMDDDAVGSVQWAIANRLMPVFNPNASAPMNRTPGYTWTFNPITGTYYQVKDPYYRGKGDRVRNYPGSKY